MTKRKMIVGILTVVFGSVISTTLLLGTPFWDGVYQNLLAKGFLQVGTGTPVVTPAAGSISVMGTLEAQGTATLADATFGNTATFSALKGGAKSIVAVTRVPGTTSTVVSGKSFGDANYGAFCETLNTSPSTVTSKTATGFTLTHATIGVTDTQPVLIVHY